MENLSLKGKLRKIVFLGAALERRDNDVAELLKNAKGIIIRIF
jgi:hypothetical protein